MSMLDSFFNKGFKAAKCKTLLKLTIPRIKLLRNRREIQIKQMRRDIAKLLETGQEATARIRVEHIIREENMMAAQEILELFCELVAVRLPIIESQRECPLDLKEAISSLCFAGPRCADLPELLQVQMSFAGKYGREFVAAATELMPDCGVNRQLIELLSIRAPSAEKKLKILKQIAEEHDVDWDPAESETELFKSHEDLLNGPTQFASGTKVPLPEEKHDNVPQADSNQALVEERDDSEGDFALDFPEVPTALVRPVETAASAPTPTAPHPEIDCDSPNHLRAIGKPSEEPKFPPEKATEEPPRPPPIVHSEEKQFVPFVSAPSLSSTSFSARQSTAAPPVPASPPIVRTKSEATVDLQDVLAAAQAAAETADRAAAAARTAASLAQLRINELTKKKSNLAYEASSENPFHVGSPDQSATLEKPRFDRRDSIDGIRSPPGGMYGSKESNPPGKADFDADPAVPESDPARQHQPQRLASMDEEAYFSYPNLFRSQSSNLGSRSQSFKDNSRSP